MNKVILLVALVCFLGVASADMHEQFFTAAVSSQTALSANIGIMFNTKTGAFTFSGVHSGSSALTSISFWSGNPQIHFNDQALASSEAMLNELIVSVTVPSFPTPITATATPSPAPTAEQIKNTLASLTGPSVYVKISATNNALDASGYIGAIYPVTYYTIGVEEIEAEGSVLSSSPRGSAIISETFTMKASIDSHGMFTYTAEIVKATIDVDGKFKPNTPFTPSGIEIRLGDSDTANTDGLLLISQTWTTNTNPISGSVFLSQAQIKALANEPFYVLVNGNSGTLRGAADVTIAGQPQFTGAY